MKETFYSYIWEYETEKDVMISISENGKILRKTRKEVEDTISKYKKMIKRLEKAKIIKVTIDVEVEE